MDSRRTVAEIVSQLGVTALAREFGHENVTTVSSWKLRGAIPVVYWPRIVEFAKANGVDGIDNDTLVAAHAHALHPSDAAPDA
jgi:hypothetical protein